MSESFSTFCKSLGCPLTNKAWSWCGRSANEERAVFTIWADGLVDGKYVLWRDDGPYNNRHGAKEMKRVLDAALFKPTQTLGIVCTAVDPTADPRKRKDFNRNSLLILTLEKQPTQIVATVAGHIHSRSALVEKEGFSLPRSTPVTHSRSGSILSDAIDDLDSPPPGTDTPDRAIGQRTRFLRDPEVRAIALSRANGRCEYCSELGFLTSSGRHYVEAHHIIALSDEGSDTPGNVIGLCSNHHREAHYGVNAEALEAKFVKKLIEKGVRKT